MILNEPRFCTYLWPTGKNLEDCFSKLEEKLKEEFVDVMQQWKFHLRNSPHRIYSKDLQ